MGFSEIWGKPPGNRQMRNRLNWLDVEIAEKNRNRQFDEYAKYQEEHNTSMFPDLEHIINGKEII